MECFRIANMGRPIECTVNPILGRELHFGDGQLKKNGAGRAVAIAFPDRLTFPDSTSSAFTAFSIPGSGGTMGVPPTAINTPAAPISLQASTVASVFRRIILTGHALKAIGDGEIELSVSATAFDTSMKADAVENLSSFHSPFICNQIP